MNSKIDILKQKGLQLELNAISKMEEQIILDSLKKQEWSNDLKRRTIQYGTQKAEKDIPQWLEKHTEGYNQIIINSYEKGQGITKHTDHKNFFCNKIQIISMMSPCHMTFSKDKQSYKILIPPRSRLVLKDEVRYQWTHQIPRVGQKRISITMRKMKQQ